jgi:hypothetical protein
MTTALAPSQTALGDILADEAVDRVARHNELFVKNAVAAIRYVSLLGKPFTSVDIWPLVFQFDDVEPRAMGAAFREASDKGWIKATGRYVKSTRSACHGRHVREWVETIPCMGMHGDTDEANYS